MPKIKPYERKIPAFYRKSILDVMMFSHVTAIMNNTDMTIRDAVEDFMNLYGINYDDYPIDSALVSYNHIRNNFLWKESREQFE